MPSGSSSGDTRKTFVLTTTANYFGFPPTDGACKDLHDRKELNTFLDDGNCPVLVARCEGKEKKINLSNNVDSTVATDKLLLFFKLKPAVITPENLHENVFVSSMLDSPIDTFYHSLQKVYAPLLLKDDKWSQKFDPKLQTLLSELEAGLAAVVRKQQFAGSGKKSVENEESVGGILAPQDEFQYWADAGVSGYDLSERERATYFQELFQKGEFFATFDGGSWHFQGLFTPVLTDAN
jgi:dynein heavy chain 2